MSTIRVEAPARLHMGMFDLTGSLGRRFGGFGVAISRPVLVVEAQAADSLSAEGPDGERALEFGRRYMAARGIVGGARLWVRQALPGHVGLGSGTRLALAVAQALAALYSQPADPLTLAQAVGRGQRSAIGLWTFAQGGLVVEGGRRLQGDAPAPLLLRHELPGAWRCVLIIPEGEPGLHGAEEVRAFERLAPSAAQAQEIAHLVLMALLPALAEGEIGEFGRALTEIQRLVGECFSPAQGGVYATRRSAELIDLLLRQGAAGAGQSSWGPTLYALAADEPEGQRLAAVAAALLGNRGSVDVVPFDNQGVCVSTQV